MPTGDTYTIMTFILNSDVGRSVKCNKCYFRCEYKGRVKSAVEVEQLS